MLMLMWDWGGREMVSVNLVVLVASVGLDFPSLDAMNARIVSVSDVILPISASWDVVAVGYSTSGMSSNIGGFTSESSGTSKGTVSPTPYTVLLVSVLSPDGSTFRLVLPLSTDIVVPVRFTSHIVVPPTTVVPDRRGFNSQNCPLPI